MLLAFLAVVSTWKVDAYSSRHLVSPLVSGGSQVLLAIIAVVSSWEVDAYSSRHLVSPLVSGGSYSPSHIVQITDFLDFLDEYCEEKSETYTEFLTNFVLTRNIEIIRWCAVVVKNQQKITCDREFSIVKSGGLKYMNFLKGIKLDFICTKMKLMKNIKYLQQKISRMVLVPQTTADFTSRVSKSYVPFTCKFPHGNAFWADSSQALQFKTQFLCF